MSKILRREQNMVQAITESLIRLGRLMMDFGFGAFLEQFEKNFGKRTTKALLLLIGLAVAVTTMSVIWNIGIKPAWILINGAIPRVAGIGSLLAPSIAIGFSVAIGFGIARTLQTFFIFRKLKAIEDYLRNRISRAEELSQILEGITIDNSYSNSDLLSNRAQVDSSQSLQDTESKTPL